MSYLVLARKWRPHTFSELVGQQHVAETLEKAIESNRIAHAFLFTGTRGVGKTSTARILAMALNCEKGPTLKPCGKCSSCREIKGGIGLDVMEIDGASNRGIDDVRELREQIAYTPAKGKYRIVIIDEVHMLTKEAFNALLKSLEEPPPNFIFIFATTEPHKVPETILSRVQRYDFRRISHTDILKRLQYICDAEKITCEAEGLSFIVRKADGSMRDALTLLDQIIPFCKDKITGRKVRSVLGLVEIEIYLDLFDMIHNKDEAGIIRMVSKIFAEGYDLIEFVAGLEEHARNILLSKIKDLDSSTINITAEEADRYQRQAGHFNEMDLLRMLEIISQLPFRVARSAMPRFEIEVALIKLAQMDRAVDISSFLNQSGSGAVKKKSNARPASAVEPESQPALAEESEPQEETAQALNLDLIKQEWPKIVKSLISENMQVGTFLTYSFVVSASASEIKIGLPKSQKFQYDQVVKPDNMRWLIGHLKDRYHYRGVISFETVDDDKSKSQLDTDLPTFEKKDISQPLEGKENINDAIKREPILGTILDVFDGEVK